MTNAAGDGQPIIRVDGETIVVQGGTVAADRRAQLYLGRLLGGVVSGHDWIVRSRRRPQEDVVVEINSWLTRHGYRPHLDQTADQTVKQDLERRRSFDRTRDAAQQLRAGASIVSENSIQHSLESMGWNFEARTLRDHQMRSVIHGLTVANPANFSVPGAGKTASTLALAAVHMANETIDVVLVVGPLACFRPWESELAAALPNLQCRRLRGSAVERRRRIREIRPGNVVLISYASAAADRLPLIELCRTYRVMLVADESHRIKRFSGGTWAPAMAEIAEKARVRVVLSGTPMPQSGRDLYSQLSIMWPRRELTGTRDRFKAQVENDFDGVLDAVLPFVSRTPKSDLGLPDYQIIRHEVELEEPGAEIYTLVANHLRNAVLAAGPNEADRLAALRRGRPLRLLQACSNPSLLQAATAERRSLTPATPTLLSRIDALDPLNHPPEKFSTAIDLLESLEDDQKAVVWSTFIGSLDLFADLMRSRGGFGVYQVDGRIQAGDDEQHAAGEGEPETREQVIAGFLDHPGRAVLVTNPASCSESISLHTACHTAIYLDRTYDCAQWLQSIDRIHRLGLPQDVTVRIHILQATVDGLPTADAQVDSALLRKESLMRQLLEGAELSPFQLAEDPTESAEGDSEDLRELLSFLLGESD